MYIRHYHFLFATVSVLSDFKALHSRCCRNNSLCLSDLEVWSLQASDTEVLLIFPGAGEPSSRNSSACRVWQVNKVPAEQLQWIDAFFHQLYCKFGIYNLKPVFLRIFLASSCEKEWSWILIFLNLLFFLVVPSFKKLMFYFLIFIQHKTWLSSFHL